MSNETPRFSPSEQDADIAQYRVLSVSAVLSLLLGVSSALGLVSPLFWIVPVAGVALGLLALGRIARNAPALTGRKAAILGLFLSVLFGASGVMDWCSYRWMLRTEARRFAGTWFQLLADDEPEKAFQLTVHPPHRAKLDAPLWEFYRKEPRSRRDLEKYVKDPLVRTLLALGSKATARYYDTFGQGTDGDKVQVYLIYAVSFDAEDGRRESFFVGVELERVEMESGTANWRITETKQDVVPTTLVE
jgi:hypothetical protein